MKRFKLNYLFISMFLLFCIHLQSEEIKGTVSQTNVGVSSRPEVPLQPTVSSNLSVSSFPGGLILSRVCLKSAGDLSPYADKSSAGYSTLCRSFAGLVVFHIGGVDNPLPKGMYVWDGDKWQRVSYDL